MTYSISIMAHPSRKAFVDELISQIGNVPVAWDQGQGIWDTCKRSWLLFQAFNTDYHFVLQDDCLPTRNFHEKLQRVLDITAGKGFIYSLYLGKPRLIPKVRELRKKEIHYLLDKHINHEIALGFPTTRILPMIESTERYNRERNENHDRNINGYVLDNNLRVYFPLPSLVNHRATKSLHNFNKGNYDPVATWFEW